MGCQVSSCVSEKTESDSTDQLINKKTKKRHVGILKRASFSCLKNKVFKDSYEPIDDG